MNTRLLQEVIATAKEAGALLRERSGLCVGITGSVGKDIKTKADLDAEHLILGRLRAFSSYAIIAEESAAGAGAMGQGPVWVVDPLDGTLNQSRAIPLACVSIALCEGGRPKLGVVYDFHRDELFSGEVGRGAACNGNAISVSSVSCRAEGVFCTGFPSFRNYEDSTLLPFVREVQAWKKVRLLGSAALSLAWLAAGRVDGYAEDDIQFWDVAAGLALVDAAGGRFECKTGSGGWRRQVRADNGKLVG